MNSVDSMLKSAFQFELINKFNILPPEQIDEDTLTVMEYLKKRISELSKD